MSTTSCAPADRQTSASNRCDGGSAPTRLRALTAFGSRRAATLGASCALAALAAAVAPAASPAAVSFPAIADLNGRAAPSLSARTLVENEYRAGQMVPVVCQALGDLAYGSRIWDKTTSGHWVTDRYVRTGYSGFAPNVPRCAPDAVPPVPAAPSTPAPAAPATPPGVVSFPAIADLNGRAAPSLSAPTLVENEYRAGQMVPVVCQALGDLAYGSRIWDKTTSGHWVADRYVRTGHSDFAPNVPRCAPDAVPAVPATPAPAPPRPTTPAPPVADPAPPTPAPPTPAAPSHPFSGNCAAVAHRRFNGPAGPQGGTRAERIGRIIGTARSQMGRGLAYAWGGGGKGGPSCGIRDGKRDHRRRYGFDCSGLTEYAFWAGAGIEIGTTSTIQLGKGTRVPISRAEAGDLVFWVNRDGTARHVALYLGHGQILEASPRGDGTSVHTTRVYHPHSFAVRIVR